MCKLLYTRVQLVLLFLILPRAYREELPGLFRADCRQAKNYTVMSSIPRLVITSLYSSVISVSVMMISNSLMSAK